ISSSAGPPPSAVPRSGHDGDRERDAGIAAVVEEVDVVVADVDIVERVPHIRPGLGPRVDDQERRPAVREARIPLIDDGATVDAERMLRSEAALAACLRHVVAAVAAALTPGAMLGAPVARAVLLPALVALPPALSLP